MLTIPYTEDAREMGKNINAKAVTSKVLAFALDCEWMSSYVA